MSQPKKILIIGAGSSGLTAIKACLEDHHTPVCLEKTLDIGGLWNYSPNRSAPGTAGIYDSLVINTCKEMSAFSDFPVPCHFPQFLTHTHVMAYFRQYAQHFSLLPHIRFNAEVCHVRRADDHEATGRWKVTYMQHAHETCPMKCLSPDKSRQQRGDYDNKLRGDFRDSASSTHKTNGQNTAEDKDLYQYKGSGQKAANTPQANDKDRTNNQFRGNDQDEIKDLNKEDHDEDEKDQGKEDNGKEKERDKGKIDQNKVGKGGNKEDEDQVKETDQDNVNDKDTASVPETRHCLEEEELPEHPLPEVADTAAPQEAEAEGGAACREVTEEYDGVMICTGHHTVPYVPEFPGQAEFQGQILHSQDYKQPEAFRGRRVLIIGIGNSAVDIASDLAKTARQVYLSTRRGSWILSRSVMGGIPADMVGNSRVISNLPKSLLQWLVERQANLGLDHRKLGLTPHHRLLGAHPTINDELPFHLLTRRVEVLTDVSRLHPQAVEFTDGSVQEVDAIIMATGYDYRLGYVDPKVLQVKDNRVRLYKYVFPPLLPHATLAVIGLVQAIGAVMPIAELQSRWFVSLITGRGKLPTRSDMEKDIAQKEVEMGSLYYQSRRHTLQTFWVEYMDELATQIGAKPDLWRLLTTQPMLALRCFFGPCLPAQYRLQGPHPWPHAACFIRSVWDRFANRPNTTRDPNKTLRLTHSNPLRTTQDSNSANTESDKYAAETVSSHQDDAYFRCIDVTGTGNHHRKSSRAMASANPVPSHNPLSVRCTSTGGTEGGWWRGVAFYMYVSFIALGCFLWLWGWGFGEM